MISPFPKIFAVGSQYVQTLLDDSVEVTEKLDGSQIAFGVFDGELFIRSKGQRIYIETADKMFKPGIEVITELYEKGKLDKERAYYGEYIRQPKHNTLSYSTTPKGLIALFGIRNNPKYQIDQWVTDHALLKINADKMGLDVVPLLFHGRIESIEQFNEIINQPSYLGGCNMEGCVVKNYTQQFLLGGQPIPIMMGKYVSEAFKEVHHKDWNKENTGKGKWETYKCGFNSEARWRKAVEHLRDSGSLESDPRDIGKLLCEINHDIELEEKENIKEWLWREFGKELIRGATKGFPEWYKQYLLSEVLDVKNQG